MNDPSKCIQYFISQNFKMRIVIIIFFVILGCGLAADNLGAQERIVGGREAGFGSFPWQAYIRVGSSRCGGSLINERHVITAGHCVAR